LNELDHFGTVVVVVCFLGPFVVIALILSCFPSLDFECFCCFDSLLLETWSVGIVVSTGHLPPNFI
jgi:hypothetical protein